VTTFLEYVEDSADPDVPPHVEVLASVVPAPQATGLYLPRETGTASVVPSSGESGQALTREELINEQLRELENELLAQSLEQIRDAQAWPEVAVELDPKDENEIPKDWVEKHGKKKAKEKFRVARASMMSQKDAPVGLKQNIQLATGIIKARAHEKTGPKILNINLVEMPHVTVQFPETEVKDRK
jgi:hypothetical protein